MKANESINKSLENIELALKSIDCHLSQLVSVLSGEQEQETTYSKLQKNPRLLTTKEASEIFGLSEFELRRGFRAGIYPAIQVGSGEKFRKIKWRYDLLEEAITNMHFDEKGELNNGS